MQGLEFYLWGQVLVYIYDHPNTTFNAMKICRDTNISSLATITSINKQLINNGLVTMKKVGRYNDYVLTPKGIIIAEHLKNINKELSKKEE